MRLKRKMLGSAGGRELSADQLSSLRYDLGLGTRFAFASPAERRAAWFRHRERLLSQCRPFERPEAFWDYEADGFLPECPASGYESPRSAHIRLGLPLTAEEKAILQTSAK
jgi:hypothetical protein